VAARSGLWDRKCWRPSDKLVRVTVGGSPQTANHPRRPKSNANALVHRANALTANAPNGVRSAMTTPAARGTHLLSVFRFSPESGRVGGLARERFEVELMIAWSRSGDTRTCARGRAGSRSVRCARPAVIGGNTSSRRESQHRLPRAPFRIVRGARPRQNNTMPGRCLDERHQSARPRRRRAIRTWSFETR